MRRGRIGYTQGFPHLAHRSCGKNAEAVDCSGFLFGPTAHGILIHPTETIGPPGGMLFRVLTLCSSGDEAVEGHTESLFGIEVHHPSHVDQREKKSAE